MTATSDSKSLSIIIPAKNEAASIADVVSAARALYRDAEILVVDDGSDDDTASLAEQSGAKVLRHPISLGNGAAVKNGVRAASGDILVMMDGDDTHPPESFPQMLSVLEAGHDLVIASRFRAGATIKGLSLQRRLLGQSARGAQGAVRAPLLPP